MGNERDLSFQRRAELWPFTEAQIDEMRARGDIKREGYELIWHEGGTQWEPIERAPVPPPPPGAGSQASRHETVSDTQGHSSRLLRIPDEAASELQAICYDQVNVLTGRYSQSRRKRLRFRRTVPWRGACLHEGHACAAEFLDARSGTTMSVQATVSQAVRQEGQWNYRLSWENCPELLLSRHSTPFDRIPGDFVGFRVSSVPKHDLVRGRREPVRSKRRRGFGPRRPYAVRSTSS